jgi:hypothetical protein
MRCAKADWQHNPGELSVSLDGVNLKPPGYVSGTTAFSFTMPAHNNWILAPGHTHGRMAVYGAASLLRPLSPGMHTLVIESGYEHSRYVAHIRYQLTVG